MCLYMVLHSWQEDEKIAILATNVLVSTIKFVAMLY